jgi:hypothetical protein
MPANYDRIDFEWSWNGDYGISSDGDIGDTSRDQIQSLVQEVQSIISSSLNDWEEYPGIGANLDAFVGEANTKETSRLLRLRVKDALIFNNIVREDDLEIKIVPVGIHSVLIVLRIAALATPNNSLDQNSMVVSLIYDYTERGVFFLESGV